METQTQQLKSNPSITYEEILLLFKETRELLSKSSMETNEKFKETNEKFKETRELLSISSLETNEKFKETDRQMRNLMKKMSESENRWGKFVEALAEGSLLKLLQSRNIKVDTTLQREKTIYNDRQYEIDLIAKNGIEVVAVEVKTTLSVSDVQEFIEELELFTKVFPEYSNKRLYGGVAFINADSAADRFAEKNGLFIIKAVGENAKLLNHKSFIPKVW